MGLFHILYQGETFLVNAKTKAGAYQYAVKQYGQLSNSSDRARNKRAEDSGGVSDKQ